MPTLEAWKPGLPATRPATPKEVREPLVDAAQDAAHQFDRHRAVFGMVAAHCGEALELVDLRDAYTCFSVAINAFVQRRIVELAAQFKGFGHTAVSPRADLGRFPVGSADHLFHRVYFNSKRRPFTARCQRRYIISLPDLLPHAGIYSRPNVNNQASGRPRECLGGVLDFAETVGNKA